MCHSQLWILLCDFLWRNDSRAWLTVNLTLFSTLKFKVLNVIDKFPKEHQGTVPLKIVPSRKTNKIPKKLKVAVTRGTHHKDIIHQHVWPLYLTVISDLWFNNLETSYLYLWIHLNSVQELIRSFCSQLFKKNHYSNSLEIKPSVFTLTSKHEMKWKAWDQKRPNIDDILC